MCTEQTLYEVISYIDLSKVPKYQKIDCECTITPGYNASVFRMYFMKGPEAYDVQMNLNDGVLTPKTSLHTTLSQKSTLRFSASQQGSWDGTCIYVYQGIDY
jgi:hypothetical protein